jgi:hypothetical protein
LAEPPTPPTLGGRHIAVATFMHSPDFFSSPNLAPSSYPRHAHAADDGSKNFAKRSPGVAVHVV